MRVSRFSVLAVAVAALCASQALAALIPLPVSHYAMGEAGATGTELDDIGLNHMTLVAGTHGIGAPAPGAIGSTASWDTDGTAASRFEVGNWITDGVTGDNYSITAWVNPDGTAANQIILSDGHGGAGTLMFQNGTGFGLAMGGAGGFWNVGTTVVSPDTWYHLELRREEGMASLLVDGVDQGLADPGVGTLPWVSYAAIGNQGSGGFGFDGQIDDVTYSTLIPEPGTLALLGLSGLVLALRRRRG